MKYLLTLIAFIVFGTFATQAQVTIKPAVGINLSDYSKDPQTGDYKSKVGWQIGGTVAFGKKWYVEPGLFYVKKSTEAVDLGTTIPDVTYDISGLRIPVAIGFNVIGHEKSAVGLRFYGGPSAFIVTSKGGFPTNEEINNAQFGLFAGAGLDISIIFVEASYEWSLTNVQKDISQIDVGKSRSVFIHAGVRIPL
ncbi:outer membrane beta-barrel protein [Pollutibacter soli]|uniref:outer membrane beta-barrel protein n=1 Tax=Pollutibacter soli TaxID=3034157 RepID=UPI003013EA75